MITIGVTTPGGPEALHLVDVPAEPIQPGHVRVRVTAATVNPGDTLARSRPRPPERPDGEVDVLGMDLAGTVTEIGPDTATDLAVGDAVIGIAQPKGTHGSYRDDIVLPSASVTRAPKGVSAVEASTLLQNGLTALQAIDVLGLAPGQVLAVTGAAGAVGGYAVQLGKHAGLTVVADAAEADEQLVRGLGADVVVRRGPDVAARFRAHFPAGVDGLVDAALFNEAVLPAVKDGGTVASVRGYKGDGERGVVVTPVRIPLYMQRADKIALLRDLQEAGVVTLRVGEVFAAADAAAAHRRLEAGGVRGRIVLRFG
jgi:NADPH:quinone reductase-like Zn-dependent oxidoreductase